MPESGDDHYSLGTFGERTFSLSHEITRSEYEEISEALGSVERLKAPFHYKLIERNFLDLRSIHQFVTITLSLGRLFVKADPRQLGDSVMTSTVNWLTSMRLFLDHEEAGLKRRFGKRSREVAEFKDATALAFDSHIGYRFSYKFRNYVQHCGLPPYSIQMRESSESGTRALQAVELLLGRDGLLASYQGWGPVKRDLEAMSPTFEALPLVTDAMAGLRGVYRVCLEIAVDEAIRTCAVLESALERIEAGPDDGHPALFRYRLDDGGGPREVSPSPIPAGVIRKLSAVATGSVPRHSLWSDDPDEPPPLRFDPATIRERFHRDSRGVQVISTWMAEGGGSDRFLDAVNGMIAEDQGIEPLVTGLINVSVVLAHMSAGALGASAEGLIAGLLDVYGKFYRTDRIEASAAD